MSAPGPNRYFTMLSRAWRLRCPRCGREKLFRKWFRMQTDCQTCGLHYEREPGYFLGSIYVNYGLTAILVTIAYFALVFTNYASAEMALWSVMAGGAIFALWFFRYARSLWLGFDHYWDPLPSDEPAHPSREPSRN